MIEHQAIISRTEFLEIYKEWTEYVKEKKTNNNVEPDENGFVSYYVISFESYLKESIQKKYNLVETPDKIIVNQLL